MTPIDPGWRPALSYAGRIATGRTPEGPILLVMRGAVVFLETAAALAGFVVLFLGAGAQEPRVGDVTARILLSIAIGLVLIAMTVIGRAGPDTADLGRLANSVFRITMRRVLVAASLTAIGMALSWTSGDAAYVLFGASLSMLLMAVASPTQRRIQQFQSEVDAAGSDLSVLEALDLPYR